MMRHIVTSLGIAAMLFLPPSLFCSQVQAGEPMPPDLSKLIRALEEGDGKAQMEAIARLQKLGTAAAPAVPALVELAIKSDLRGNYTMALHKIGKPAVPAMLPLFDHKDVRVRIWAIGFAQRVMQENTARLGRVDAKDRDKYREEMKDAALALANALDSDNVQVRQMAVDALQFMGVIVHPVVVPQMVKALDDPNETVAYQATCVLKNLGTDAKSAIPDLIKSLERGSDHFRYGVARSLAAMGPDAKDAVPALVRSLNKPDTNLSAHNLALAQIGPPAVPPLVKALTDKDEQMRQGAYEALRYMALMDATNLKEAVPTLAPLLRHADPVMRLRASTLLAGTAPHLADAADALGEAVNDEDRKVRHAALYGLRVFGAKAAKAVPALTKAVGDPEPTIRLQACMALGRIGPEAKSAVPILIKAHREDPNGYVRGEAGLAVRSIDPAAATEAGIR